VGVFISFTLSQSGMVRHWLRDRRRAGAPRDHHGAGAVADRHRHRRHRRHEVHPCAWIVVLVIRR